jgi:hypothetical protein
LRIRIRGEFLREGYSSMHQDYPLNPLKGFD